jgi:hypothetical protein
MQDPRIRIFVILALSVAAFISIAGAVAAFIYWLIFTPGFRCIKRPAAITFFTMIVIVALVTQITTGNGLSYFIRLTVVLLLALYAYTGYYPGEFLAVSVWMFGRKSGFDLGIIAEMSMQSLGDLENDVENIRMAIRQKGIRLGIVTGIPVAGMVVINQITRAKEQADLLTVRGYTKGGTLCPRFPQKPSDIAYGFLAIFILVISFFPIGGIFILLH